MGDFVGIAKEMIAGGVGGACLVLVGHPLDTVKVKIQTMVVEKGKPPPYTGAFDCVQKIVKREGPYGLYKGMLAPLTAVTPMYSLCFFGYGIGKSIFTKEDTYQNLTYGNLFRIALAGATSGFFTTPILAPTERLKCILQAQDANAAQKWNGPRDLGRHIYETQGVRSLFRGYWATNLRDSVASMAYFSTYEWMKYKLLPKDKERSQFATVMIILFCGGSAGIANWIPAIPIDTLKSRYQISPEGTYPNGIRSVAKEIMQNEGFGPSLKVMYRGFGAVMLRAFPANAACFLGYETAKKVLNGFRD